MSAETDMALQLRREDSNFRSFNLHFRLLTRYYRVKSKHVSGTFGRRSGDQKLSDVRRLHVGGTEHCTRNHGKLRRSVL